MVFYSILLYYIILCYTILYYTIHHILVYCCAPGREVAEASKHFFSPYMKHDLYSCFTIMVGALSVNNCVFVISVFFQGFHIITNEADIYLFRNLKFQVFTNKAPTNIDTKRREAGKLHSQTFFECKLTAQGTDESVA